MNGLCLINAQAFRQALGRVTRHAGGAIGGAIAKRNLIGGIAGGHEVLSSCWISLRDPVTQGLSSPVGLGARSLSSPPDPPLHARMLAHGLVEPHELRAVLEDG